MDNLLSFEDALDVLGISHPTLYKLLKEKKIDGYFLAGKWKFKQKHIDDYIERCRNLKDLDTDNVDDRQ